MEILSPDENLIASVARATCFAFRFEAGEVPASDVHLYVDELIALYRSKPTGVLRNTTDEEPETVESSMRFCADQLERVAPEQAAKLRSVLSGATQ